MTESLKKRKKSDMFQEKNTTLFINVFLSPSEVTLKKGGVNRSFLSR